MASKGGDRRPEVTDRVDDANLLEKINLTFPEVENEGRCKWWLNSCDLKTPLRGAGVLLAFHVMNIAVTTVGAVAVALLIAGLLLNCCWVVLLVVVAPFVLLFRLPHRLRSLMNSGYLGFMVLYMALFVVSFIYVRQVFTIALALVVGGGAGLVLFYFVLQLDITPIKAECRLVNYISPSLSWCSAPEKNLLPDECVNRIMDEFLRENLFGSTNIVHFLPLLSMTYRAWVIVFYFGVCKTIVGGLSAAAIFCSVIQPAMSIFSGGHAPLFFSSLTFHSDPTVYVVAEVSCCVAGGVGLVIVAVLSAKSTWCVFSEPAEQQEQTPATPTQEANGTSYAELALTTPA